MAEDSTGLHEICRYRQLLRQTVDELDSAIIRELLLDAERKRLLLATSEDR